MTELKYDPELPFAYASPTRVYARFAIREDAEAWQERIGVGDVIDTRPKPKIPEDAEFICYSSWADSTHYARRIGHPSNNVWETSNPVVLVDEEDLLARIGDAEVTVLVRKEEP